MYLFMCDIGIKLVICRLLRRNWIIHKGVQEQEREESGRYLIMLRRHFYLI